MLFPTTSSHESQDETGISAVSVSSLAQETQTFANFSFNLSGQVRLLLLKLGFRQELVINLHQFTM